MRSAAVTQSGSASYLSPDWVQASPTTSPPALFAAGTAYDATTHQVVMFGGDPGLGFTNATWLWDGTSWSLAHPATVPPVRASPAMAWDPALGEVVMFGGVNSSSYLTDTWAWNGSNWSQLATNAPPSGRMYSSMAFDPAIAKLVLFGGFGPADTDLSQLNDTWTFDGTTWADVIPQGAAGSPSYRGGAMMASAEATVPNQFVLFGGHEYACAQTGCADSYGNDTWLFNGTSWLRIAPPGAPPARGFGSATYDAGLGSLVVFGGLNAAGTFLNDTWAWNGNTWLQATGIQSPPGRDGAQMASLDSSGQLVVFGGAEPENVLSDTWVQNLTPGAPTTVVAFAGNGQGEVTWATPAYGGGTPIDSYVIIAVPATGADVVATINCGLFCTSGVVPGLANGVSWSFAVYAHDGAGYGLGGVSAANVTPSANPPPYPPTATIASAGNADAYVTWTAPPANGGAALADYIVNAYDVSGGSPIFVAQQWVGAATTSLVFGGLTNAHPYSFTAYSYNSAGYQATPDGGVSTDVTPSANPAPFPVTSATATAGDTSVLVHWTPPASGAAPTQYAVYEYSFVNHTASYVAYQGVTAQVSGALFTGLADGTSYVYVVYAANANGYSSYTFTNLATPEATLDTVLNPSDANATPADATAVLTWTAPLIATPLLTTYSVNVYRSPAGGGNTGGTLVATDAVGAATSACSTGSSADPPSVGPLPAPCAVIGGLVNGTSYYFSVAADTLGLQTGLSVSSPAVTPAGRPFPPIITAVNNVPPTGGAAQVTWTAPSTQANGVPGDNGSPIVSYTITATPTAGANPNATAVTATYQVPSPDPGSYTDTLSGLYSGTTYDITITATNAVGTSDASTLSSFTPAGVPFAPTNVTAAVAPSPGTADVAWSAPGDRANGVPGDNGGAITSYTVTASSGASMTTANGTATSLDFTGLAPGTYTFTVSATNAVGTGPASGPSPPLTLAGLPSAPGSPALTTTTDPSTGAVTATVTWAAASDNGSMIQYYTVTPEPEDDPPVTVAYNQPYTATFSGLQSGVMYDFYISATNGVGTGTAAVASDSPGTGAALYATHFHYPTPFDMDTGTLHPYDPSVDGPDPTQCSDCATTGAAYSLGQADAQAAATSGDGSGPYLQILEFNKLYGGSAVNSSYGALQVELNGDQGPFPLAYVQTTVFEYAAGWYSYASQQAVPPRLRLVMGINNSGLCGGDQSPQPASVCQDYSAGALYAYALSDLVKAVNSHNWEHNSIVYVWAGSDTETDPTQYGGWNGAQTFQNGYTCVNYSPKDQPLDPECQGVPGTTNVGSNLRAEFFDYGAGGPSPGASQYPSNDVWTSAQIADYASPEAHNRDITSAPNVQSDGLQVVVQEYSPDDMRDSWSEVMNTTGIQIYFDGVLSDPGIAGLQPGDAYSDVVHEVQSEAQVTEQPAYLSVILP